VAINDTPPAATKDIEFPEASMVATAVLLLLYVIAPLLSLVGAVITVNDASPYVFELATSNVASENVVGKRTASVLLVLVALAYWLVSACVAINDTSPTSPTKDIKSPEASMVAIAGSLLLYVISPLLLLVGRAIIANDASLTIFCEATANVDDDDRLDVPSATVSVLLVIVALSYTFVAACVAINVTLPDPTKDIEFPEASIVATAVLLLLYVIAPPLLLVGRVVIANDASPYVFELATVNVDADNVDVCRASTNAIPLEFMPSPPYK
jgi:hypothetical protein